MKAKLFGGGIVALALSLGGAGCSATDNPAPAPPAQAAVSSPELERSVSAPAPAAPKAVKSTPVPVRQTVKERATAEAKPKATPELRTEPSRSSEPSRSNEPPVSSEAPAQPVSVAAPPELPKPRFDEVTIAADSVLGVSLESTISSETAKVEDRVNARLSRDLLVNGKVAVPAGARPEGVVTDVTRGGKFKERPRVGVTFQQLILADGTKIALTTDTVFRDGDAPANVNAKVGGSGVVGAILGDLIGVADGAVLGGAAAAATGAAAVAAGDRAEVVLLSGSSLTVRLKAPITVLVERHHEEPPSSR